MLGVDFSIHFKYSSFVCMYVYGQLILIDYRYKKMKKPQQQQHTIKQNSLRYQLDKNIHGAELMNQFLLLLFLGKLPKSCIEMCESDFGVC